MSTMGGMEELLYEALMVRGSVRNVRSSFIRGVILH